MLDSAVSRVETSFSFRFSIFRENFFTKIDEKGGKFMMRTTWWMWLKIE
jgi:hypothetical protein